ncbi:MAG: hypothetical protein II568_02245, partial [Erysipelotrichaceae bacterium]|nr:hypothetical protein [Erysipelotrichaceae bacterium]
EQTDCQEGYLAAHLVSYHSDGQDEDHIVLTAIGAHPFDDREVYAAIGDSGNIIYIDKEKKISLGITGTFKPRIFDRVQFIEGILLPAIE